MSQNKIAYFQGGGGVNEPTPKDIKYKAEPAILVQPRFEEPLYYNYDVYNTEGVNGPAQYGPGAGWHHMHEYKSIKEYLQHQRQRLKGKYVADDMWITEENRKKRVEMMSIRAVLLSKIVKTAQRNFDYGTGLYENLDKYDSVKDFIDRHDQNEDHLMPPTEHGTEIYNWKNSPYQGKPKAPKRDSNHIDFQYDAIDAKPHAGPIIGDSENYDTPIQLGPVGLPDDITISPGAVNLGEFESYPYSAQLGGMYDKYLGKNDQDDKPESTLDWSNDLPESIEPPGSHSFESVHEDEEQPVDNKKNKLDKLEKKYLNPAPTHGLFGLPDGVDLPDEDLGDPTDIQPDYGTLGPSSKIYEDKWNI